MYFFCLFRAIVIEIKDVLMPMASNKLDNFKELVLKQRFVIVLLKEDALKRDNNAGMHMVHMI